MIIAIMPTHSRRVMMQNAIESVLEQTIKPDLMIVLDNGSIDGTKAALVELCAVAGKKNVSLTVIRSELNLGASGGMKFLIEKALEKNPDWIWFVDDDAVAEQTALEKLIQSEKYQDQSAYILTSKIVNQDGIWTSENRPARFIESSFDFQGIDENEIQGNKPIQVDTGGYCGWFVRSKCFSEFGFPKAELYFWFDDIEYVVRVSRKKKVYLIPDSVIRHFATSLVQYEKKWPFSGPLPKIPLEHLPRYFYWYRNYLWFARQWMKPTQYFVFWVKHLARAFSAPVLFHQKNILMRWKILGCAFIDAAMGRLGKKEGL